MQGAHLWMAHGVAAIQVSALPMMLFLSQLRSGLRGIQAVVSSGGDAFGGMTFVCPDSKLGLLQVEKGGRLV